MIEAIRHHSDRYETSAQNVNALILSAGRGSRLLPLTATRPKCLVPIGGKPILEWQLQTLAACGVGRSSIVVGFGADEVSDFLENDFLATVDLRTVFNPLYDVADNLISCWTARAEMGSDFILLNGDTLFEQGVVQRLLASDLAPVTVAISRKSSYDDDDMKVSCSGSTLLRIGKDLPMRETNGESIGMLLFRQDGPELFRDALERAVRHRHAASQYYLSVINDLAARGLVKTASMEGLQWTEVDFLSDVGDAARLVNAWHGDEEKMAFPGGAALQPSVATD
jgi:choline kinase